MASEMLLTETQKKELFDRVITNNASNNFVYQQLEQTILNTPSMIIPFIGAGLSRFAYKAWGSLLQDLLNQLADQELNAPDRNDIQGRIDDGDFFQAADKLETLIESDVFYFTLASSCNENILVHNGIPKSAAVRWIPKVFRDSRIITTNYDCVLEFAYAEEGLYLRTCSPSDSRMFFQYMPRRLFKIHGSYDSNYEEIVLTEKSYQDKYKRGGLLYNNFKHVVQSSVLFFLGASLRSDKTLDVLKEIATEYTIGNHYCGNMHYAVVHIDNDVNKQKRRKELAQYKILPILYSDSDHSGFEDKNAIVSVILERLYQKSVLDRFKADNSLAKTIDPEKISTTDETTSFFQADQADTEVLAHLFKENPLQAFSFAINKNNLAAAEKMLPSLARAVSKEEYLTKLVPALTNRGSSKAAEILLDNMNMAEFVNGSYRFEQLLQVAGSLVSYCTRHDKEIEYLDIIRSLLNNMLTTDRSDEKALAYNQLSRLYYGAYTTSMRNEQVYLENAKQYLDEAILLNPKEPSFYYNMAVIEEDDNPDEARKAIDKCIECGTNDIDHLTLAFRMYKSVDKTKAESYLASIRAINSGYAELLDAEK